MEQILRETNVVADLLAKYGREMKEPLIINNQTLFFLKHSSLVIDALERDVNGTISYRLVPFCMAKHIII